MSWQVLVLGNATIVALTTLLLRQIAKHKYAADKSLIVNAWTHTFQYLSVLAYLPLIGGVDASVVSRYWPWLLGGGLAFALTNVYYYKVFSYLDAGFGGLLSTLNVPFTLLLAAAILHESLRISQLFGALVLLGAIIYTLLLAKRHAKHHTVRRPWAYGLLFAVLSASFYSLALVNEKFMLGKMTIGSYLCFGLGAQMLASQTIAIKSYRRQIKLFSRTNILLMVAVIGVSRGFSAYMSVSSQVKSNNLAEIVVGFSFRLILIVLLSAWLLKERQKLRQKLIAAAIAIIGLSILFWR